MSHPPHPQDFRPCLQERVLNEKSQVLSLQPDPSFFQNSFTGTGINVEGGKAREIDVQAEKHHGESEGTHAAKPNQLGPGKAQCDWSVSLKNMPRFSEVQ